MTTISDERLAEMDNMACDQMAAHPNGIFMEMDATEAHEIFSELQSLRAQGGVRVPFGEGWEQHSLEDKLRMQKDAGTPHLPTDMTFEARKAISGEGPRAFEWSDKKHRLVYDLCSEIERLAALSSLEASPAPVSELCACMMGPNDPDPKCTVCGGSGDPSLEPWQVAFSLAAGAMSAHGMPVACPWEGDLDDVEAERFNALVAAINAYLTVCPALAAKGGQ